MLKPSLVIDQLEDGTFVLTTRVTERGASSGGVRWEKHAAQTWEEAVAVGAEHFERERPLPLRRARRVSP